MLVMNTGLLLLKGGLGGEEDRVEIEKICAFTYTSSVLRSFVVIFGDTLLFLLTVLE